LASRIIQASLEWIFLPGVSHGAHVLGYEVKSVGRCGLVQDSCRSFNAKVASLATAKRIVIASNVAALDTRLDSAW